MNTFNVLFYPYLAVISVLTAVLLSKKHRISEKTHWAVLTASLVVVVFYYANLLAFTTNIPFIDDYNLLDSFYRMLYAPEAAERFNAWFEQVNEHRFPFERLVMYLIYLAVGTPDLKVQIFVGNFFILGIAGVFFYFFRQTRQPTAYFIPVLFLLFSLAYYENINWGIASIQNIPVVFFALLSGYGLGKQNRSGDVIGLFSAVFASFTSGSGISVWVIGIFILLIQRRIRFMLLWALVAALVLSFYFGYDFQMYPKDRSGLVLFPVRNFGLLLSFLGNGLYFGFDDNLLPAIYPDIAVTILAGTVFFILLIVWVFRFIENHGKRHDSAYSFLTAALLFPAATGSMLVISRPIASDVALYADSFSPRYLIFGVVMMIASYLVLLFLLKSVTAISKRVFQFGLILGALVNLLSWFLYTPKLAIHKQSLKLDPFYIENYGGMLLTAGGNFGDKLFWNHPTAFPTLIEHLKNEGLYEAEPSFDNSLLIKARELSRSGTVENPDWEITSGATDSLDFGGRINPMIGITAENKGSGKAKPVFFLLQSEDHQFVLPAVSERGRLSEQLSQRSYWSNRFTFYFRQKKFPPGDYDLLLVFRDSNSGFYPVQTGFQLNLGE